MLLRTNSINSSEGILGVEGRQLQLAVSGVNRGVWHPDWSQFSGPVATQSRAQHILMTTLNTTTLAATPTATNALRTSQVPGRMLSFKSTAMSWLKGGSKGHNNTKKGDITTSGSVALPEEVTDALAVIQAHRNGISDFSDMDKDAESPRTRLYTPTSATHSRVTSPTLRDASPLAIEAHSSMKPLHLTAQKQYDDPEEYILASPQEDEIDTILVNERVEDKTTELVSPLNGKKKGVKLKMAALNILRMKSSMFLRKPQDGDEQQDAPRRRGSVDPFPNSGDKMTLIRSNTAAGTSSASTPIRRPARLTKAPPADLIRQRRSTMVESIQEDNIDPIESRPIGWGTVALRPSSSHSTHPGGAHRGDDGTSLAAAETNVVTGGNVPGGLYPRPSSLKRHWSDGPQGKRDPASQIGGSASSPPRAATEGSDRARPLSFAGMLNTYGSMKITEAATLENRVRDLESQVATLQTVVTTQLSSAQIERRLSQKSSRLSQKSSHLTNKSAQTSPALGPPFSEEEMALSKRPDTAQSNVTTSTFMHGHESEYSVAPDSSSNGGPSKASESVDWRSIARGGNAQPYTTSSLSSYRSEETIDARNRPYAPFDHGLGLSSDASNASKRSTVISMETITPSRNQHREYEMDYHRERAVQTPAVTMTEYNGVLKLLRREYRARKKLENQVQTLQEQMNHVLHRQLLQADPIYNFGRSPTITARSAATTSAASTQRPEPMNKRRTSSEVPTPDLTPPRGRPDMIRGRHEMFSGFDSGSSAMDDTDDDRSFYNNEDDDSEHWQTPAEDSRSLLQQIGGHLAPPAPPASQKRTMSISQITEKASLASARAAANR